MRQFTLLVILLLTGLFQVAFAQNRSISGRVLDRSTNQGLPGVTVLVKGTTIGTATNNDGGFVLSVPESATTLTFSFIGYTAIDQAIGNGSNINVSLAPDSKQIGEVVVTGALGIQRQSREIGYATATIDDKQLTQARVANVTNGLAGKVSGLQISTLSNGVNPNVRVTLRGQRSITGDNQALIVVDGVLSNSDVLSAINPDDIDDITVLKGANAAALYGSQATNGALIITTKKGNSTGKPTVTFSHTSQFESVSFFPKLQTGFGLGSTDWRESQDLPLFPDNQGTIDDNTPDYYTPDYTAQYQAYENQQFGPAFDGSVRALGLVTENGNIQTMPYVARPNERQNFFNTGYQQQNNASFSGGDEKSKIYLSFQNLKNNGIIPKDQLDRNTFRLNASREFGRLSFGFNASYSSKKIDQTSNIDRDHSPYWQIINTGVQVPLTQYKDWQNNEFANPNGYYNEYYQNPYFVIDNNRTKIRENYLFGDVNASYKLADWITAQYRVGATIINQFAQTTQDRFSYSTYVQAVHPRSASTSAGFVSDLNSNYSRLNSDALLNINKTFGALTTKLILGNNTQVGNASYSAVNSNGLAIPFVSGGVPNLLNRVGNLFASDAQYNYHQTSLFADLTLGYKEFIFLHGSGRNDWTSTLNQKNRSFFYPSGDISIVVSEAIPALKDAAYLDYFKLRGGIARVGQVNLGGTAPGVAQTFGAYALQPTFGLGSGYPFGASTSFTANDRTVSDQLKPEFNRSLEAGAELSLLKRRIALSGTYYNQKITNLTLTAGTSLASGFSSYLVNAGEIKNEGYELDVNLTPIRLENGFEFRIGANYNHNDTKLVSLLPGVDEVPLTTAFNANLYAIKGQSFPVLKGSTYVHDDAGRVVVTQGQNPFTGEAVYFPTKAADAQILGNTQPKDKYGFNTSISYKGFAIAAQAEYRTNYYIYNTFGENLDFTGAGQRSAQYNRQPFTFPNSSYLSGGAYVANTDGQHQTPGGSEFWANAAYNTTIAENYLTSGKFFKLREVTVSYNVPSSVLSSSKFIKGVGLNVFARNLYTWVPKENIYTDPEYSFTGNQSFNASPTGNLGATLGSNSLNQSNAIGINSINQTPPTRFIGASVSATF